ncbi:MAG: hypothetical protein ORN52_07560 [Beijerinckiaceae bacterium]|nr:hypothetical protein [Beijerinckiaceae bacterium]
MSSSKIENTLYPGSMDEMEIRLARRQLEDLRRQAYALAIQLKSLKAIFRELEQNKSEIELRIERLVSTVH